MSNGKAESDANGENAGTFKLGKFSVDDARPMKVIVIGAGYSGKR